MVRPRIGTVDFERAEQVLETAPKGVQESQARFVILDITGLRHVDTNLAGKRPSAILRACQSAAPYAMINL